MRIASEFEKDLIDEIRYTYHKSKSHQKWLRNRLIARLPKQWRNIYYPKNK